MAEEKDDGIGINFGGPSNPFDEVLVTLGFGATGGGILPFVGEEMLIKIGICDDFPCCLSI